MTDQTSSTPSNPIPDLICRLAKTREDLADYDMKLKQLLSELYETDKFQTITLGQSRAKASVEALTREIKDTAVARMLAGFDKGHPAVGIRHIHTTIANYDRDQARVWAEERAPALMTLDIKKFEKYAISVSDGPLKLPFVAVEIKETITATIATDLTEYIPIPGVNETTKELEGFDWDSIPEIAV